MKNKMKYIGLIIGVFSLLIVACEDKIDPIIEEIQFERVFTPLDVTARIRNMTTAEISWNLRDDADSYVVEISEDSLQFASIIKTVEVARNEVPVSIVLEGQTQYSARVKGVSTSGPADSKWAAVAFKTDAENIFLPLEDEAIKATSVTLKWPAGETADKFIILPGNTERALTADEIEAGEATITGLTSETEYTIRMVRGTKQRGEAFFTTLVDIGDATAVYPEDDLSAMVAAAAEGDVLVLFSGEYLAYTGTITLNKSISIKGRLPYDKPIVHVQFVLEDGVQNVEIADLEMAGSYTDPVTSEATILDHAFQYNSSDVSYGALRVTGCTIHDYNKSLFAGSSSIVSTIESITMNNCVVTNILTNSADGIDFRGAYLGSLSLTNSTFVNCAPGRDFIRLDDTSGTFPGRVTDVLIDRCTLYGVSNSSSRRILYVRFVDNTLTVTNSLIAETAGYYTNQSRSSQPDCSNNNYFNAGAFIPGGTDTSGALFDQSTSYTTLDPGFEDAANGIFTVSNQALLDNQVGDPRWLVTP